MVGQQLGAFHLRAVILIVQWSLASGQLDGIVTGNGMSANEELARPATQHRNQLDASGRVRIPERARGLFDANCSLVFSCTVCGPVAPRRARSGRMS